MIIQQKLYKNWPEILGVFFAWEGGEHFFLFLIKVHFSTEV